jgi:hypothetical protein
MLLCAVLPPFIFPVQGKDEEGPSYAAHAVGTQ